MKTYLDQLRPFEKRLVVGIVAMLFIVLNLAFVFPHFSDWGRTKTRLADAQWTLEKFNKEIAQVPSYTNQIDHLIGRNQDVAPEDQLAEFSHVVNIQAGQSQISINNAQKVTVTTNQFFVELSQNLSVQSSEEQLVDFLYSLGSGTSQIRVRGLTIKPDLPRQQLSAAVTLVASYQKKTPTPVTARPGSAARTASRTTSSTVK